MGKYMKKPKMRCDVAVMEVVGVRTRAKTLALQKLQSDGDTSSYLQLRSRRIGKTVSGGAESKDGTKVELGRDDNDEDGTEDWSVGENNLEFDARGRSTRESTPCSFIRAPVTAETPESTTRQTSSTATTRRSQIINPTAQEIDDFFANAEKQQHKLFAEKYNFDVVNDVPLPGRYEWVRVEN